MTVKNITICGITKEETRIIDRIRMRRQEMHQDILHSKTHRDIFARGLSALDDDVYLEHYHFLQRLKVCNECGQDIPKCCK